MATVQSKNYASKAAFLKKFLTAHPNATYPDVRTAWLKNGNKDDLFASLYYIVRRKLENEGVLSTPMTHRRLLTLIDQMLSWHEPDVVDRAYSSGWADYDLFWDARNETMHVEVKNKRCRVKIVLPKNPKDDADVYCTCPQSDGVGWCEHTYGALKHLQTFCMLESSRVSQLILKGSAEKTVEQQPNWAQLLDQLGNVAVPATPTANVPETERLTWRIGSEVGSRRFKVECYKQTISRNGGWTRGRRMSLHALFHEKQNWVGTPDESVLACIELDRSFRWSSDLTFDVFVAMEKLVGHPNVYWFTVPEERVTVVTARLGLGVKVVEQGYQLYTTVGRRPCTFSRDDVFVGSEKLVYCDFEANRAFIASTSGRMMSFLKTISQVQPIVPKEETENLLDRLNRLESVLEIELPEELSGGTTSANSKPVLRLTVQPDRALCMELGVYPFNTEDFFPPAVGAPQQSTLVDNRRSNCVRNFSEEKARCQKVQALLAIPEEHYVQPWKWGISDPDAALDFIGTLQAIPSDELTIEWANGLEQTVVGNIAAQSLRVDIKGNRDWFGISGGVEIAGCEVPLAELLQRVRQGSRYVEVGDGKWATIEKSLRDRLLALSDASHSSRSGLEIGRTALPIIEDLINDEVAVKASKTWQTMVKRLDAADALPKAPPKNFQAELRDYQLDGFQWLRRLSHWGVGACLADDMGLGKTIQALGMLVERSKEGPALVVCPTSVGFNWVNETQRFAPTLNPILYRESDRENIIENVKKGDVVITSYGLLRIDFERFNQRTWSTLILDEAQFVKNAVTKTARAARDLNADWRLALTGTPLENHIGELWSIFRVISPGLFGSWERFKERFADPIERREDKDRRHALSRLIRPFVLRRTKAEVLDELPGRTETHLSVEMSAAERRLYEDERLKILMQLTENTNTGEDARFQVLAALTRLRQLACHPKLVDASWRKSSAKLDLLKEVIQEVRDGGHRSLVFSQFVQHLKLIREMLDQQGISYQYLDGQTTAKQRKERVEAFQAGEGELFLISLKAGGTGLNLTAADYVIHVDPWWNPAVEDQATDRAHRIGQTRPVTVYRLVTRDTIEEQIIALHAEKRELIAGILDGTDQAAKLSTEELVSLIRQGGTK